jgi:nucleoside-diphosphate-sugar epimerase
MKTLVIGGSGFIGPFTIRRLQQAGHDITVFHRGKTACPDGVQQIIGDRNHLDEFRDVFARHRFDMVIDFLLVSERQARQFMATFAGITQRTVVLSSMDAYRAWGVLYGTEPGGLEPLPIQEDSALRTVPFFSSEAAKQAHEVLEWVDAEYDKVPTERVVLSNPDLPCTVLRLPMVYGPGDYIHRFYPFLKRMDDGRPFILFAGDVAAMRSPRGYVEDVANGIALAATLDRAAGRVYNICEAECCSELEWARKIATATGWKGEFIQLPREKTPAHLVWPFNTAQHMVVSSERIRRELGYREVTQPEEAFRSTILWERAHPPQNAEAAFNYQAEDEAAASLGATA